MRAGVVFDTRFGNTETIARAIETGLRESGFETECLNSRDVAASMLGRYDLVCVGAPTEMFGASKAIKDFLGEIKGKDLSGKYGFAFDTKLDSRFSGSASKTIERDLRNLGTRIVAPRQSAIVSTTRDETGIVGATLKAGEEQRFMEIGKRIGATLVAGVKPIPA